MAEQREVATWIGDDDDYAEAPTYTYQDECAGRGHPYYGDDVMPMPHDVEVGRCYCGAKTYPKGGE